MPKGVVRDFAAAGLPKTPEYAAMLMDDVLSGKMSLAAVARVHRRSLDSIQTRVWKFATNYENEGYPMGAHRFRIQKNRWGNRWTGYETSLLKAALKHWHRGKLSWGYLAVLLCRSPKEIKQKASELTEPPKLIKHRVGFNLPT